MLIVVTSADSIALTSRYFQSENIAHLRKGNVLFDYLKENQGDERIYFLDQTGIYNRWLAIEAGYHMLRVFNIWQMPRMPAEYKALLSTAGRNVPRLWQLASIKYITAPSNILGTLQEPLKSQLKPVMFYRFVLEDDGVGIQTLARPGHPQDQVLLEFNARIPRFSLFHDWALMPVDEQVITLFEPAFDPLKTVLVDAESDIPDSPNPPTLHSPLDASTDRKTAVIHTNSDKEGILLFTQRFQPNWRVTIDGQPAELLKCNYLCMGVAVPKGEHTVEFSIRR